MHELIKSVFEVTLYIKRKSSEKKFYKQVQILYNYNVN